MLLCPVVHLDDIAFKLLRPRQLLIDFQYATDAEVTAQHPDIFIIRNVSPLPILELELLPDRRRQVEISVHGQIRRGIGGEAFVQFTDNYVGIAGFHGEAVTPVFWVPIMKISGERVYRGSTSWGAPIAR